MARKVRIDMTGLRFGRLVGIDFSHRKGNHAHWLFQCDCGNETIADGTAVRAGNTQSCGCLHREVSADRLLRHGRRAGKRHDATYRAWQEINTVCSNPASPRYRDFGAVGIDVCPAWKGDFGQFLADMGERPAGTILTRIYRLADFEPSNCRWIRLHTRSRRALDGHARRRASVGRRVPLEGELELVES